MNCCNALAVGITYLARRQDLVFHSDVYCNMWGVTHRLLSSLSVFNVAVLSISRTYVLLKPFKKLNILVVEFTMGLYFLVQAFLATIPFWELDAKYAYKKIYATCETPSIVGEHKFEKFNNITSRITYFGPIIPILISCAISVGILLLRNRDHVQTAQKQSKRYASVTIVIFTLLFATFNIPGTIISLFELIDEILAVDPMGHSLNFFYYMSIPINSALNPTLYMFRMHCIKDNFFKIYRFLFKGGPNPMTDLLSERSRSARSAKSVMMNKSCTRVSLFIDTAGVEMIKESFKSRPTACNLQRMMGNEYQVLRHQKSCQL